MEVPVLILSLSPIFLSMEATLAPAVDVKPCFSSNALALPTASLPSTKPLASMRLTATAGDQRYLRSRGEPPAPLPLPGRRRNILVSGGLPILSTNMAEPTNSDIIKALEVITKKLDTLDSRTTRLEQSHGKALSSDGSASFAQGNQEHRPPKFHKVDFPKFDGTMNPMLFLNKCESYFLQQRIVEEEKVWLASFNMEGAANQHWYMRVQREEDAFWSSPARQPDGGTGGLPPNGTVADYSTRFLKLLARVPDPLRERQQIQLFTAGLGDPLGIDVQMQNPLTLEVAISLARSFEQWELAVQALRLSSSRRALLPTPTPPLLALPPAASRVESSDASAAKSTMVGGRTVKRLTPQEMEKRRRLGLCFNCDEKYARDHNRACKHLFLLELDDADEDESAGEEESRREEPVISLHAITGVRTSRTMQVPITLAATQLLALLDFGSTHNFISLEAAERCGQAFHTSPSVRITVANASTAYRSAMTSVIPLAGYDIVLGTQWLASLGPILWNFEDLTMAFWRHDHRVEWKGSPSWSPPSLRACHNSTLLDELLDEFGTLFAEPQGLPPRRDCDHWIHLLPGATPVVVRPYRYPALQKDELERQCR
ncbi:hypothetical protein U9M48_030129 [Paspalum notatum var. saurae]|uniref:Retrotransposon gag domain-containing protein n=1 Tax=Paspalum notatum var. saurae TaxID=547442 RepID=A0AAQ3U075_PASNO